MKFGDIASVIRKSYVSNKVIPTRYVNTVLYALFDEYLARECLHVFVLVFQMVMNNIVIWMVNIIAKPPFDIHVDV